jgi:hypothetical protein
MLSSFTNFHILGRYHVLFKGKCIHLYTSQGSNTSSILTPKGSSPEPSTTELTPKHTSTRSKHASKKKKKKKKRRRRRRS